MLTTVNRSDYHTLLDAVALTTGDDHPAIIYVETGSEPITVTRREFAGRSRRAAEGLHRLGVGAGDLVIIAHTQSLESIDLFWGALRIGAIPSMFPTLTEKLDPDVYIRNMGTLIAHSGVKAVLTTDAFAPTLRGVVACDVYGSGDLVGMVADKVDTDSTDVVPIDPSSIAFLQHSSGTTGLQKGVALSHRAALNQLAAYSEAIRLNERDVIVSWLPLYHDMGLIAGFLLPLVQGIPLVLMSPFDWVAHPALLLQAISDYKGTLCWLPNFAYNHMARRVRVRHLPDVDLRSMRMFINCSEPVRDDSHQQFVEQFAQLGVKREMLAVSYAMAENTFAVTQTPPGHVPTISAVGHVSCGVPIKGTQVQVVDEAGNLLPDGATGEIAIKSDCMLSEYYRRADLHPFTDDGWYRTGDMGYVIDGEVYVAGRKKDIIINAGKNVYPQDIEAVVGVVDGVKAGRVVVFGVPDERDGTELIAVVAEVADDDPERRKAINKAIRQRIAAQTTNSASYVTLVDPGWLLKTSSGKIARAANRDKWLVERI